MVREGLDDDMSNRVLDHLWGLLGEAKEKRVAVVDTGGGTGRERGGGVS